MVDAAPRIARAGLAFAAGFTLSFSSPLPNAVAQQGAPAAVRPETHLSADMLYRGWRASQLLGREAATKDGKALGTIRNVLVGSDAKITAVLVERQAAGQRSEFVFRLPWEKIDAARLPKDIVTGAASGDLPELDIFAGNTSAPKMPREFAVTEVVGEYARLQAGQGYGYVSDIVFSRDGTMIAVLITRGLGQEGGTYAFGFPGFLGQWRPDMSYYGLPYVTAGQATAAGLRVDPKRFEDGGAG